jgi:hypothetical protein
MEPSQGTLAWLKWRKRTLLRDIRALDDFTAAHSAISRIIECTKSVDEDPTGEGNGALFMMAVVTYARPFAGTKRKDGSKHFYATAHLKQRPQFDNELHDHLVALRNKLIAHDDEVALEPKLYMYAVEVTLSGSNERKPIGGTLCSYSLLSASGGSFMLKVLEHLSACIEAVRMKLHSDFGEFLTEAHKNPDYLNASLGSDHQPELLHNQSVGANQTSHFASLEEWKSRMVRVPAGQLHKEEYVYRSATFSLALDRVVFGEGENVVTLGTQAGRKAAKERLPSWLRVKNRKFIEWWKKPLFQSTDL